MQPPAVVEVGKDEAEDERPDEADGGHGPGSCEPRVGLRTDRLAQENETRRRGVWPRTAEAADPRPGPVPAADPEGAP